MTRTSKKMRSLLETQTPTPSTMVVLITLLATDVENEHLKFETRILYTRSEPLMSIFILYLAECLAVIINSATFC